MRFVQSLTLPRDVGFRHFELILAIDRRYNKADECLGGGIRLGGHVVDGVVYGVDNEVTFPCSGRCICSSVGTRVGYLLITTDGRVCVGKLLSSVE